MGTLYLRHGSRATAYFLVLTLTRLACVVAFVSQVTQDVGLDHANVQQSPELPMGVVSENEPNAFTIPQGVSAPSEAQEVSIAIDHDLIVETIQSAVALEPSITPPNQDVESNPSPNLLPEAAPVFPPSQEALEPDVSPQTANSITSEPEVSVEGVTLSEVLSDHGANIPTQNGKESLSEESRAQKLAEVDEMGEVEANLIEVGTHTDPLPLQEIREVDFLEEGEEEEVLTNSTIEEYQLLLELKKSLPNLEALTPQQTEESVQFNQSDDNPHDDIPSFSEWTQKVLAEAEKGVSNGSLTPASAVKVTPAPKLRQKNYASPDCGAKILAANAEAQHVSAVLDPSADEYFLSACTARIFFVLELCEAIQARKIELANYELFSSSPKEFRVSISDRYPSRDWAVLGNFVASDQRSLQGFTPEQDHFGKFVKVELLSHYGTEHYCPISLFRVYGTSEYEVLNHEEDHPRDTEDADEEEMLENGKADVEPKNLFGSAKDAVLSIVKKAAEVLVKSHHSSNQSESQLPPEVGPLSLESSACLSLNYVPICPNCSSDLLYQVTKVLECQEELLVQLSHTFQPCTVSQSVMKARFMQVMFGKHVLLAFCNYAGYQPEVVVSVWQHLEEVDPETTLNQSIKEENWEENASLLTNSAIWAQEGNIEAPPPTLVPTSTVSVVLEPSLATTSPELAKLATLNVSEMTLDRLLSEVADLVATPTEATPTEAPPLEDTKGVNLASVTSGGAGQKESVFMRLANRIKALERNMSLSSQYLEELSRRYKRQVDDMQKTLNRTLLTLNETLKRMSEQEERHFGSNMVLQKQLEAISLHLTSLEEEKENVRWMVFQGHAFLAVVEVVTVCLVGWICFRKVKAVCPVSPTIHWHTPQPSPDKLNDRPLLGERSRLEDLLNNTSDSTSLLSVTLPSMTLMDCIDCSPSPSLASSCDSAFSNPKGSRETSPSREPPSENWQKQHRRKKREGKRSLPNLMTSQELQQLTGPNAGIGMKRSPSFANGETSSSFAKNRILPMGSKGKLKSDNWAWHAKLSRKSPEIEVGMVVGGNSLIVGH